MVGRVPVEYVTPNRKCKEISSFHALNKYEESPGPRYSLAWVPFQVSDILYFNHERCLHRQHRFSNNSRNWRYKEVHYLRVTCKHRTKNSSHQHVYLTNPNIRKLDLESLYCRFYQSNATCYATACRVWAPYKRTCILG